MIDFFNNRIDYEGDELSLLNTPDEPNTLFTRWINECTQLGIKDSNAMVLSTIDENNLPHSRVVLLKEFANAQLLFFSNYQSAKGNQLDFNPNAAVLFFWREFYRQIRIEGKVYKISDQESDEYFQSRPLESRINAIVSPQSNEIVDKKDLLVAARNIMTTDSQNIKRPDYWGGYRLNATYFEFWQGQPNRLHDRIIYKKAEYGWKKKCLAP